MPKRAAATSALLFTAAWLSAACTVLSPGGGSPESALYATTGRLEVFSDVTLERGTENATPLPLTPGRYRAVLDDVTRRRLTLLVAAQGPAEVVFELDNRDDRFPTTGDFDFPASVHNQPVSIRGTLTREAQRSGVSTRSDICTALGPLEQVCVVTTDAEGKESRQCRLVQREYRGRKLVEVTRNQVSEDVFMRLFDPATDVEVARFFEEKPTRYETSLRDITGCQL